LAFSLDFPQEEKRQVNQPYHSFFYFECLMHLKFFLGISLYSYKTTMITRREEANESILKFYFICGGAAGHLVLGQSYGAMRAVEFTRAERPENK
jgi:hypothetical protein